MRKTLYGVFFLIIVGACASIEIFSKSLISNRINSSDFFYSSKELLTSSLLSENHNSANQDYENLDSDLSLVLSKIKDKYKDSYINEINISPQGNVYLFEVKLIQENSEYELSIRSDVGEIVLEEKDVDEDFFNKHQSFMPNKMMDLSEIIKQANVQVENLVIEELEMERIDESVLWTIHTSNGSEVVFDGVSGEFIGKYLDD